MESFSSAVKSHVCQKSFLELGFGEGKKVKWKECCSKAFLRAVFLFLAQEEEDCILSSPREDFLELCAFLLIRSFDLEAKVLSRERGNRQGALLMLPGQTKEKLLKATEPWQASACPQCRVLYLRAAFLSCGTLTDPEKGYHAAFRLTDERVREELAEILSDFDIDAKKGTDGKYLTLYLKESGKIEDLLSAVGAQSYALKLMDRRVEKNIRAATNRRQNFDNANMQRVVNGAQGVIAAIHFLKKEGVFETLPESLQNAARLRESYPADSLADLCLYCEEPMTKSGLNHRFQRLCAIAEKIRQEKEEIL